MGVCVCVLHGRDRSDAIRSRLLSLKIFIIIIVYSVILCVLTGNDHSKAVRPPIAHLKNVYILVFSVHFYCIVLHFITK